MHTYLLSAFYQTNTFHAAKIRFYYGIRKAKYDNIGARTYVETKFLKDFKFTMNYSYDLKMYNGLTYYTPTVGDGASFKGRGTKSTYNARTTNFNQLLSYDKTI